MASRPKTGDETLYSNNPSRRTLIGGATAAPLFAGVTGVPASAESDGLVAKAAHWIATEDRLNAIQRQWQAFESLVFDEAHRMNIGCDEACRSDMPEARAMRALDVEIEETRRRMDAAAEEIRLMPATTIEGAIAKIELGLKVQGPFDWQEHALELLENGVAELRGLLGR